MIYRYPNRYIVQFSDESKASYSIKRYGKFIEKISQLSEKLDRKIWNYFEINGNDCNIFYQKDNIIYIIIIDKEDYTKVQNYYWTLNHNGYPWSRTQGTKIYLYHLIYETDKLIDHIDRNPLNNKKNNLRIVDYSQNNLNHNTISTSSTGINGVTWDKTKNKWRSRIRFHYKEYCEYFDNFEEAVQWRKELENKFLNVKFND